MHKKIKEKLEILFWDRYFDVLSYIPIKDLECFDDELLFTDEFYVNLKRYVDEHWESKTLSKRQAYNLYDLVWQIKDYVEPSEEWNYIQLSNLLRFIPVVNNDYYSREEYVKRFLPFASSTQLKSFVEAYMKYDLWEDINIALMLTKAIELDLISDMLFGRNRDFYLHNLGSYVTQEGITSAVYGIISDIPEILEEDELCNKITDIVKIRYSIYNNNKFFNNDTTVSLTPTMENNKKINVSYRFSKDVVKEVKKSKDKQDLKLLVKIINKEV